MNSVTAMAAKQAASHQMSNVADDIEAGITGEDEEEEKGLCGERTWQTIAVHSVAITSIVFNLLAIAVELSYIVYIAGGLACLFAPIVIFLQFKLQDTDSMRKVQNMLRQDVNNFSEENNKLTGEVNRLEVQVGELKVQEQRLDAIAKQQGTDVNELVRLVKENQELIDKQQEIVRHDAAQLLSQIVINSDRDSDGNLEGRELRELEVKLRSLPGVKVNEQQLKQSIVRTGGNKGELLKLIYQVTREEDPMRSQSSRNRQVFSLTSGSHKEEKFGDEDV